MLILALSTSSSTASVAIYNSDTDTVIEKICTGGKTHSETLMPTVSELFEETAIEPAQIDMIAVDVGPGSFTGVRIGVATGNAMAMALNKQMAAVSSLEALAFSKYSQSTAVLLDARNGNGYAAHYTQGIETMPPSAVVIDEFISTLPDSTLFLGDGATIHKEIITAKISDAKFDDAHISAANVAKHAFLHKDIICVQVLPLYLKPSQAERLHGK